MPDNIFIDTNIIIYALGPHSVKTPVAASLLAGTPFISTQVLSETSNVVLKRLMLPISETRKLITSLESICCVEIISPPTIYAALNIREQYHFSWYDSLIIAAALQANCTTLYSEDLQHEQVIEQKLIIKNPFVLPLVK